MFASIAQSNLMLSFFNWNVYVSKEIIFPLMRACVLCCKLCGKALTDVFVADCPGHALDWSGCLPLMCQSWGHLPLGRICWVTWKPHGELCSAAQQQRPSCCHWLGAEWWCAERTPCEHVHPLPAPLNAVLWWSNFQVEIFNQMLFRKWN